MTYRVKCQQSREITFFIDAPDEKEARRRTNKAIQLGFNPDDVKNERTEIVEVSEDLNRD